MALEFPTLAERAVAEFRNSTKTVSLAKIARDFGAEVTKDGQVTTYTFDDDTSVTVEGRGPNHQVETHLP